MIIRVLPTFRLFDYLYYTNGTKLRKEVYGQGGHLLSVTGYDANFTVVNPEVVVADSIIFDKSLGYYGQLGVSILSIGLMFCGTTAPLGLGVGAIDALGGFKGFYNFLDDYQQFYKSTGLIIIPINGMPQFFSIKNDNEYLLLFIL